MKAANTFWFSFPFFSASVSQRKMLLHSTLKFWQCSSLSSRPDSPTLHTQMLARIGFNTKKQFARKEALQLFLPSFSTVSPSRPLCSLGQSFPSAAAQQILRRAVEQESICDMQLSKPGEDKTCRL